MFHTPTEVRSDLSSSAFHLLQYVGKPLAFPAAMDLCDRVPVAAPCDGLRLAAEAGKSASREAFRPAFATGDWRVFASYCIARRLAPNQRVVIPGRPDRTLRFLVEGSLLQESATAHSPSRVLLPGAMLGEDALFSEVSWEPGVRTLEASLILELSLPRHKELTASCPEIGFELLRAAGAVIAARGRTASLPGRLAPN
ncbi:MAG: hypothetical protein ACJ8GJ_23355 [Vitreoscilla sp.]